MISFLAAAGLLCGRSAGKLDTLYTDLLQARAANKSSCERYLQAAFLVISDAVTGKDWPVVEDSLIHQGISKGPTFERPQDGHSFRVPSIGYMLPNGSLMPLEISLTSSPKFSEKALTIFQTQAVRVELAIDLNQPLGKLDFAKLFAASSSIDLVLKRPQLVRALTKYSSIGSVKIDYSRLIHSGGFGADPDSTPFYLFEVTIEAERQHNGQTESAEFACRMEPLSNPLPPSDATPNTPEFGPIYAGSGPPQPNATEDSPIYEGPKESFDQQVLMRVGTTASFQPVRVPTAYTGGDLRHLPAKTTTLWLQSSNISAKDMSALSRFSDLGVLDVQFEGTDPNSQVTEDDWSVLGRLRKLQVLQIESRHAGNRAAQIVATLPDLKELDFTSKELTDAGVQALAKSRKLTRLWVDAGGYGVDLSITDKALPAISAMSQLMVLGLNGQGHYTGQGLASLSALKNLSSLSLCRFEQTGEGDLNFIGNLKNLRELSLTQVMLGPDSVKAIASLTNLRRLDLTEVKGLNDEAILSLSKLKNLNWLSFYKVDGVTSKGIAALKPLMNGAFIGF
jgi:Leucine-rich repeat (LRR) protein